MQPVWPDKNRQMSIKVGPKWFHQKSELFWLLYENWQRMWEIWAKFCCQMLSMVAQMAKNRPIWSHWMQPRCNTEINSGLPNSWTALKVPSNVPWLMRVELKLQEIKINNFEKETRGWWWSSWLACWPSSLTIRVQIRLKSPILLFCELFENKRKRGRGWPKQKCTIIRVRTLE